MHMCMYYTGENDQRVSASTGDEIVSITVTQEVTSGSSSLPTLDREYVYTLTTSGECQKKITNCIKPVKLRMLLSIAFQSIGNIALFLAIFLYLLYY